MKNSKSLILLSTLTAIFAGIQAAAGLFWMDGRGPFAFTTLHGQTIQMYGQGVYGFDTYFKAPILRGTDAITLFVAVPLLIVAIGLYGRGSLRGGIFLTSILSYFVYNAASLAFGAAYNNLFLLYVAYFSAGLFSFVIALRSIDAEALARRTSSRLPRRGIAALMFVAGIAVMAAWLGDILSALFQGTPPDIGSYTTEATYVIDLGIIVPIAILTVILLLRRDVTGLVLAPVMTLELALIGLVVSSQTVFQSLAGITLSAGAFVGKAGSFIVLSLVAVWMTIRYYRSISERE